MSSKSLFYQRVGKLLLTISVTLLFCLEPGICVFVLLQRFQHLLYPARLLLRIEGSLLQIQGVWSTQVDHSSLSITT